MLEMEEIHTSFFFCRVEEESNQGVCLEGVLEFVVIETLLVDCVVRETGTLKNL